MAEHNASAAYADYTPLQRLALLSWWLAQGEVVTLEKAAVVLGVTRDAAHAQLWRLAGVVAIAAEHDRWLRCPCPLHDDAEPSFWIDTRDQVCGCFAGCTSKPLDVINLYARLCGLNNREAIFQLARLLP